MRPLSKVERVISWICRKETAIILLQTLFFKFTGAQESVYIFTNLGLEPRGRYGAGVIELIAAVLLLSSCHAWLGGLLALGEFELPIPATFLIDAKGVVRLSHVDVDFTQRLDPDDVVEGIRELKG